MELQTALDHIQDRYDLNGEQLDDWRDQMRKLRGFDFDNIIDLMDSYAIEVAKFHVEAALKAASENVMEYGELVARIPANNVDKESILNAYPLDNIKNL